MPRSTLSRTIVIAGHATFSVYVRLPSHVPAHSVAVIVKVCRSAAFGIPLSSAEGPHAVVSDNHRGRPAVKRWVPSARIVAEYIWPTTAPGKVSGSTVVGPQTFTVLVSMREQPFESFASTMKVYTPGAVAVPDNVPSGFNVVPGGSDPSKSVNVCGVPSSGSQQRLMSSVSSAIAPFSEMSLPDTVTPSSTVMSPIAINVPTNVLRARSVADPFTSQNV